MSIKPVILEDLEPQLCQYLVRRLRLIDLRMVRHEVRVQLWLERQQEGNDRVLRGLFADFLHRHRLGRPRRNHRLGSPPQATRYRPNPDWH